MNAKDTTQVVDHFAKELAGQFHLLAPQALKVLAEVKQIDSVSSLISAVVWIIVGIGIALIGLKYARIGFRETKTDAYTTDVYFFVCLFSVVSIIFSVAMFFVNLNTLTDQWLWIGVFHPNLAVYHDIIVKALGK